MPQAHPNIPKHSDMILSILIWIFFCFIS